MREAAAAAEHVWPPYLSFYSPAEEWEQPIKDEERSVAARDLFAATIPNEYGLNDAECNPFAAFLTEVLARLEPGAPAVSWARDSMPHYRICAAEAESLLGGDKGAIEAILDGTVALHQMPRDIRNSSPEERAQWVSSAEGPGSRPELEDLEDFSVAKIDSSEEET